MAILTGMGNGSETDESACAVRFLFQEMTPAAGDLGVFPIQGKIGQAVVIKTLHMPSIGPVTFATGDQAVQQRELPRMDILMAAITLQRPAGVLYHSLGIFGMALVTFSCPVFAFQGETGLLVIE